MRNNRQLVYLILLVSWLMSYQISAQHQEPTLLRLGIFTEAGTHPGIVIGATKTLKSWEFTKVNTKKQIPKIAALVIIPQIGMYSHPKNHTGLLAHIDVGVRRQKKEKRHYHLGSIGIGSLTQFNSGTTYLLDENGSVEEKKNASRTYIHTTLAYELGQARDERINWYLRFQIGAKFPYNTYFSLVPIIQIGVNYQLNKSKKYEK